MLFINLFKVTNTLRLRNLYINKLAYHSKAGTYGYKPVNHESSRYDGVSETDLKNRAAQSNLYHLITSYRKYGHKIAKYDPLKRPVERYVPELDPGYHGVVVDECLVDLAGLMYINGKDKEKVSNIVTALQKQYSGEISTEFMHIPNTEEREWFGSKFEEIQGKEIASEDKVELCKLMLKSQAFDNFVANKFTTTKRYGGEGGESAMCFYEHLFKMAANDNISDVVVCSSHRGRLNLLTCIMKYPPCTMFKKMKGMREFPPDVAGSGDVLSHLSNSVDVQYNGKNVHLTMIPNPSHLEAGNPVAVGKCRGKMRTLKTGAYSTEDTEAVDVLCLQLHGDAAFAAQGVVAETLNLADVPHFTIGGSIHFIVNNQVGFTTEQSYGRSSAYSSCVGKLNNCPIIRVNADSPEDVIRACELAMQYRQRYHKDVIIDYVCYRRWGHNEVDEPAITQPIMYDIIRNRKSIPDLYRDKILSEGLCTAEELDGSVQKWHSELSENLSMVDSYIPKANHLEKQWHGLVQSSDNISTWDTGVNTDVLKYVGVKSVELPADFNVHPSLNKPHIQRRLQKLEEGSGIDWATAEAMAMGSLLYQGYDVRFSGQDVGRGTFSHRHCMFVDQQTDDMYIPLNNIQPQQNANLEVCNSILSEEAVLGFEYGVSIESPDALVIWEAQFGDFFNGAQIIIDTYISGGETKWLLQSGLVMLLPHGMDGSGPEHSSCKIERFLQDCDSKEDGVDGDNVNMQIANPTTPSQYFHLLRRQMVRNFRKPLVVVGPKLLLRHPSAVSNLSEMAPGTCFQPVLNDPNVDVSKVTKLVFVSGKHYYTLAKERETRGVNDMAIIRIESLCPFPVEELRSEINKYSNAKVFVWGQEEHRNQGAWNFVSPRFENTLGLKLTYVGRDVHATPATGIGEVHKKEVQQIADQIFSL